jgi:hypothetical protein
VEIRREHRGRRGIHVVAELRYPSLGLDLLAARGSGLLRGRHHDIDTRDPRQHAVATEELGPALEPFDTVEMDDTHAVASTRDAGVSATKLARITRATLQLALAVARLRAETPPPTGFDAPAVRAWRELAARLEAPLELSRMAVEGTYRGLAAVVITEWAADASALRTRIGVSPARTIDEQHAMSLEAPRDAELDDDAFGVVADAVRPLVARVATGAQAFSIAERVEVVVSAPLLDPAPVLPRLRALAELVDALAPGAGPYR